MTTTDSMSFSRLNTIFSQLGSTNPLTSTPAFQLAPVAAPAPTATTATPNSDPLGVVKVLPTSGPFGLLNQPAGSTTSPLGPVSQPTQLAQLSPPALIAVSPITTVNSAAATVAQQASIGSPATNVITDPRVRIALPAGSAIFYKTAAKGSLLYPLSLTDGVVFPYQPKIDITYKANYESTTPAHSNFSFQSYKNSQINEITISGDFPVRTPVEGQYLLACITFLRSLTMMFTAQDTAFGITGGTPPQIVRLWGMGFGGLDNIPVAITSVTSTYSDDVNFVTVTAPVAAGGGQESTKVPTKMPMTVTVVPLFSRAFASGFSVTNFSSGQQRLFGAGYK